MLHKRSTDPPPDTDEVLTGTCRQCGTLLEIPRWQAHAPPSENPVGKEPGNPWSDCWYAECPTCRERSPTRNGTRVYMAVKRKPDA